MKLNKRYVFFIWVLFLIVCGIFFFFNRDSVSVIFTFISSQIWLLYILIFVAGSLRGFTLIPATYLIVLALPFISAVPLYFLIMSGVMVSSLSVYYFFEYLQIDELFGNKHKALVQKARNLLSAYELPVIIFWSMAPFLPSDIICYISGTLRVNVYKFMLGMFIGEGVLCAVYIFGGKAILGILGF